MNCVVCSNVVKFLLNFPMLDIFCCGHIPWRYRLVLNLKYMQQVHTRNGDISGIMFFLQTSWSAIDLKLQTLKPKSVWNLSLMIPRMKVITKPMQQYGTRMTQKSWSNSLRLGWPWRTRPRCANRIRTVLNMRLKRAVLLKRTSSPRKRHVQKSKASASSGLSWEVGWGLGGNLFQQVKYLLEIVVWFFQDVCWSERLCDFCTLSEEENNSALAAKLWINSTSGEE